MDKKKIAIGLRCYEKTREALASKMRFLDNVPWGLVGKVYVAINIEKDKSGAMEYFNVVLNDPGVEAFAVQPWFKTGIPALNSIIHKATAEGFSHIWFVSTRLVISQEIAEVLIRELDDETLVVGAVMPGHRFPEDIESDCQSVEVVTGDGETCPYNTCAIYKLGHFHRTGFLPISEMPTNPNTAGNEEIAAVALQQQLFGNKAKLVLVPGIKSQTDHWDDERKERHNDLLGSKNTRSESQLQMLPIKKAKILHIH